MLSGTAKLPEGSAWSGQRGQQVAVPALELTLIDAQDEVLARRVLLSEELFASADSIEPGADWSPSVEVLLPAAVALRTSGYRLLAFYP